MPCLCLPPITAHRHGTSRSWPQNLSDGAVGRGCRALTGLHHCNQQYNVPQHCRLSFLNLPTSGQDGAIVSLDPGRRTPTVTSVRRPRGGCAAPALRHRGHENAGGGQSTNSGRGFTGGSAQRAPDRWLWTRRQVAAIRKPPPVWTTTGGSVDDLRCPPPPPAHGRHEDRTKASRHRKTAGRRQSTAGRRRSRTGGPRPKGTDPSVPQRPAPALVPPGAHGGLHGPTK